MRYTFRLFQLIIIFLFTEGNIYAEQTFERGFGTPYEDLGTAVCHTSNTGYVVGGKTKGFSAGANYDFYFVKFNLAGNVLWSNHYGTNFDDIVTGVIEYTGGELYAVGNSTNAVNTYGRIILAKLNSTGQILWTKFVGDTNLISSANELVELPNGNIAICGRYGVGTSSALISIVDSSGSLISTKNYSINNNEDFTDLIVTNDGYIASTSASSIGNNRFILVYKMDLFGDTIWTYTSTIFLTDFLYSNSIVQGLSGNYYVGGYLRDGYSRSFYHQIDSIRNFIRHIPSSIYADNLTDLGIVPQYEGIYSANGYFNYAPNFACQYYDTTMVAALSQFKFFEYSNYSFEHSQTNKGPYAIDVKLDLLGNGNITLAGGTRISNYGDFDVAIIHTDDGLMTRCKNSLPQISAHTSTSLCPGDSVLITLDSNSYVNHHWVNFKGAGSMDLGVYSDSIWIKTPGFYFYIGFDADSSIRVSNEIRISILDTPSTAIATSGPLGYCLASGAHLDLSVTQKLGCSYQWFLNNSPLLNDTSITVNANSTGEYFCQISNQCNSFNTDTFTVNCAAIPPVQINTSNADMWVNTWCNTSGIMYFEINEVAGANYQWLLDGVPISGSTLRRCDIIVQGDYSCIVSDSCGNDTSDAYIVFEYPYPQPGTYPNQQLCSSLDSVNLWSDNLYTLISQWYFNGSPITGATGQFYNAKQPGNYSFDFTTYQCWNSTMRSSITTITSGTTPPFDLGNDTLICHNETLLLDATTSNIYYYYWNTGATTSSIIASSGVVDTVDYFVRLTWSNYCISYDTITIVFDVCTEIEDAITEHIKLYPTTTQDQLTLEIPENRACIVKIIDPLGKMVYEKPTDENNIHLDVSELSMGIYLLYIERNNKRSAVFKFIKTN